MASQKVRRICRDIKALKIQGAREVAKAAVSALYTQTQDSSATSPESLKGELIEAADMLAATRPTEPMLRNSLRYFFSRIKQGKPKTIGELKAIVRREKNEYLEGLRRSISAIAEYGARELPKGATVLIHCHSHTVMEIMKRAHEMGKGVSAVCTETRPMFQGRTSAKELSKAGIPTTLVVDSAMKTFIEDADVVLVGADSIDSVGNLINKIGTSTIALVAFDRDIKFYSAAELYKFDPMSLWGSISGIEERDPWEVADPRKFRGVSIRNPAFDITLAKYITAYVTEKGVLPPQSLLGTAMGRGLGVENPMSR